MKYATLTLLWRENLDALEQPPFPRAAWALMGKRHPSDGHERGCGGKGKMRYVDQLRSFLRSFRNI